MYSEEFIEKANEEHNKRMQRLNDRNKTFIHLRDRFLEKDYEIDILVDKKNKTISLQTSFYFHSIEIIKHGEYFHFNFKINQNEFVGNVLSFKYFGKRKYYPKELKIAIIDRLSGIVLINYFK